MVNEFNGKWVIILGGSSGLGLATAKKLASHGMNLCIVHRDSRAEFDRIETEFSSIRKLGIEVLAFNADAVREGGSILDKIERQSDGAKIYGLVHSIAKGSLKPITGAESLDGSDIMLTIEAMAVSLYDWTKMLHERRMLERDARIIAYTSEGSTKTLKHYAAVSAAKSALESISRSIAVEMASEGIRCNCVQAGVTDTKSLRMIPQSDQILANSIKRNPNGRLTTPEDVANIAYLLFREEANWITGTTIIADGGERLR